MRSTLFPAQTQTAAPYQPLGRTLTAPAKSKTPVFPASRRYPFAHAYHLRDHLSLIPAYPVVQMALCSCLPFRYLPSSLPLCHLQIYPLPAVIFVFTSRSPIETLNNLRPYVSPRGVLLETLLFSYGFPLITMLMSLFSICLILSPLKMCFPCNSFSKDGLWMPCRGLSVLSSCSCFYQLNF